MQSKFPYSYDSFTEKKNRIVENINGKEVVVQDGDDILAEHINVLQDSIVAIEKNIGINANGNFNTISERLDYISNNNIKAESIFYYNGDITTLNGFSNINDINAFLKNFNIVILKYQTLNNKKIDNTIAYNIIVNISDKSKCYIAIDFETTNIQNINTMLSNIKELQKYGLNGVLLDNFDYAKSKLTRKQQNDIIEKIRSYNLEIIIASDNEDEILNIGYHEIYNNDYTPLNISENDSFMLKNKIIIDDNIATLNQIHNTLNKFCMPKYGFKDIHKIKIYTYDTIENLNFDTDTQKLFFVISTMYDIDGMCFSFKENTEYKIITNYNNIIKRTKEKSKISYSNNVAIRYFDNCVIKLLNENNKIKYEINNLKIPGEFIDFTNVNIDLSTSIYEINANNVVGSLKTNTMQENVIKAINLNTTDKINFSKIDDTGLDNAIEQKVGLKLPFFDFNSIKQDNNMHVIKDMYITENIIVTGENKTITTPRLIANYVYAKDIKVENSLDVKFLKAKALDTNTIIPSNNLAILSNLVEFATKKGLNKFLVKAFLKDEIEEINIDNFNTLTPFDEHVAEIVSHMSGKYAIDTSKYSRDNGIDTPLHIAIFTKISMQTNDTINLTLYRDTLDKPIKIYLNNNLIYETDFNDSNRYKTIYLSLNEGINELVILTNNDTDNSYIFFTQNITNTLPGNIYTINSNINRIDCFMDSVTKISGDLIETGTIKSKHIDSKTIKAEHIDAKQINADHITSNSINSDHIQSKAIKSDHIEANQIVSGHIATGAITSDKIDANQINSTHIAATSIKSSHITSDAVKSIHIESNSILTRHIMADQIVGTHIKSDSIDTNHIKAGAVKADQIDAKAIKSEHIDAGQIISDHIKSDEIESRHIKAGSIDATKLSVSLQDDLNNMKTQLTVQSGEIALKADKTEVQEVANKIGYKVEIISTNGFVFKNGIINTTLKAIVYEGKNDITNSIDESKFRWRKILSDGSEDIIWGNNNAGKKEINIDSDDVIHRATFICEIIE